MKAKKAFGRRVLARTLATELTAAELYEVCGQGTSYTGTGGCDAQGRGADVEAVDCVQGGDTFKCQ